MSLNKITKLGIAYPPEQYPDPVRVSRQLILSLYEVEKVHIGSEMAEIGRIITHLRDQMDEASAKWVEEHPDQYLKGLTNGFEVKRYRVALEYSDKTKTVLYEGEDLKAISGYASALQATYQQRGYILRKREDKAVDLCVTQQDAEGQPVLKTVSVFRVSTIAARQYTPVKDIRNPTVEEKELQEGAE